MRVCRATLILSEFASAHHMKLFLAIKQSVCHQRVQVRMKVEIFAEGVNRHNDGWNAVLRRVANAACVTKRITQKVTHVLMRDAAELLQQSAVKSKVRPLLHQRFSSISQVRLVSGDGWVAYSLFKSSSDKSTSSSSILIVSARSSIMPLIYLRKSTRIVPALLIALTASL